MVKAFLEHEGNRATLHLTTHFGDSVKLECEKSDDEEFRLGGTAVNEVAVFEGVVLDSACDLAHSSMARVRGFHSEQEFFDTIGILSPENWPQSDRHCYLTEYYPLDMEGRRPGWFVSRKPLSNPNYLFVNLDIVDGGGNVLRRYRVSPFTGESVEL